MCKLSIITMAIMLLTLFLGFFIQGYWFLIPSGIGILFFVSLLILISKL
jgi:hypothetical protein